MGPGQAPGGWGWGPHQRRGLPAFPVLCAKKFWTRNAPPTVGPLTPGFNIKRAYGFLVGGVLPQPPAPSWTGDNGRTPEAGLGISPHGAHSKSCTNPFANHPSARTTGARARASCRLCSLAWRLPLQYAWSYPDPRSAPPPTPEPPAPSPLAPAAAVPPRRTAAQRPTRRCCGGCSAVVRGSPVAHPVPLSAAFARIVCGD